jgi:hypothetical protein
LNLVPCSSPINNPEVFGGFDLVFVSLTVHIS